MNFNKKYSYKNLSIICENLSNLYKDGLQISKAISLLNEFPLRNDYKNSIKVLVNSIMQGESLSEGFMKNNNLYPKFFVGMISIGEKTGRLQEVLNELSIYYKRKDELLKDIINFLIYPMFLLSSMIFILIFVMKFMIPQLEDIYKSIGNSIPYIAQVLIDFSYKINESPIIFILSLFIWVILIPCILFKNNFNKIINLIFKKNKIFKEFRELEVILVIKIIVLSGVNISLGLKYCEDDILNKEIYKDINKNILSGLELSESLKKTINLSEYSLAMIRLGEESGSLDNNLDNLYSRLYKKNNDKLKKITAMFQPIIIVIMSILILAFIGIFILPIFQSVYGGII